MASEGDGFTPSSPPRALVGGRYRVSGRLGRGGMGTVWRATDELLRRSVAIKELHLPDPGLSARQSAARRERALREARTAALIRHPHVVVVHDVVEHEGHPWIVMELVDGRSLASVLEADGPLGTREAARVGASVAGALRAAHARGIQHRDVKPANVLIEHESGRVVLTDFGIARAPGGGTVSETGAFVGSPEYTAPERMSGAGAGPESDLWSLGALLCAAVHGESPFRRDSIGEIVHAVAIGTITPPRALGPLLPVVTRLLDRDPAARMTAVEAERVLGVYARAGEAPEAVPVPEQEPGLGPEPVPARVPREPESVPARVPRAAKRPWPRRGGLLPVVAVGALVVLAVAAGALANALVERAGDGDEHAAPAAAGMSGPPPFFPGPGGPPPDGLGPPPPGAPGGPPLPPGFRIVEDRTGFSVALPGGYVREARGSSVGYRSADRALDFGERVWKADPRGPYAVLSARHRAGPADHPGYRDGVVTRTLQHQQPAALWQFTSGGGTSGRDGGTVRRTFELSWSEGGRMYEIRLSAPVARVEEARGIFDTARFTFRPR